MAFGIDDALSAAAAGISLTDTIVQTVRKYRREKKDYDLELLLEQVRITALERIDTADQALAQFERMLLEKKVDIDKSVVDVAAGAPFWRPWEQHRLSQIQKQLHHLWDSVYAAGDDIAALVRCREMSGDMGQAVADSAYSKHELHARLLDATVRDAISILRAQLQDHKDALNG